MLGPLAEPDISDLRRREFSILNKTLTIIMRIFNYCHTGFTYFFPYISTFLNLKRLNATAIIPGSTAAMLMFCFVPICFAGSDTLQIAKVVKQCYPG